MRRAIPILRLWAFKASSRMNFHLFKHCVCVCERERERERDRQTERTACNKLRVVPVTDSSVRVNEVSTVIKDGEFLTGF